MMLDGKAGIYLFMCMRILWHVLKTMSDKQHNIARFPFVDVIHFPKDVTKFALQFLHGFNVSIIFAV